MPQIFHTLQCYSCRTFQVHYVKKVNKWQCKMCGEKQSIIKVHFEGSGADCRKHVQTLNMKRGEMEAAVSEQEMFLPLDNENPYLEENPSDSGIIISGKGPSKWSRYVEESPPSDAEENDAQECYTTDRALFQKNMKDGRKRRYKEFKTSSMPNESKWGKFDETKSSQRELDTQPLLGFNKGIHQHDGVGYGVRKTNMAKSEKDLFHIEVSRKSKWTSYITDEKHTSEYDQHDSESENETYYDLKGNFKFHV